MESYGDTPGVKQELYGEPLGAIHLDQYETRTCVPATFATQIFSQAKERTGGEVVFD